MEFVVFDGKIKRSTRITLCRRVATVGRSGPESLSTARCGEVFFFAIECAAEMSAEMKVVVGRAGTLATRRADHLLLLPAKHITRSCF